MASFLIPSHLRRQLPARPKVSRARQCLAAIFIDNKGYGGFPLAFDVSLPPVACSWERVLEDIARHDLVSTLALNDAAFLDSCRDSFDEHAAYTAAQEWMRASLHDTDCYLTLRPEVAAQFGVRDDLQVAATFELQGRSGKHLVVTEFEGHSLRNVEAGPLLDPAIKDEDADYFDADWVRKLCAMATEWALSFSPEAVHKEFHYMAASFVANDINDAFAPTQAKIDAKRAARFTRRLSRELGPATARYGW